MLSNKLVNEIQTAANIIGRYVKHDTEVQLLFIGQSPSYLSYYMEKTYNVKQIAFSGRPFMNMCDPTQSQLTNYFKYLDTFNIDKTKKILLIDHSHTGESITAFSKVLNRYFGYIQSDNSNEIGCIFDFLNIISPIQQNGWIRKPDQKYISVIGYIVMPSLVELANEVFPRTIPSYKYWDWNNEPNFKPVKEAEQIIRKQLLETVFVCNNDVSFKYPSQVVNMGKQRIILSKKNSKLIYV
jgi:hypothetical protein